MRIGVVGTGRMGSALGRRLVAAGHEVVVGSRDTERARRRAAEIGAVAGGTYRDAAEGAAVVVLAVPWWGVSEALELIGDLDRAILVDVTNPFKEEVPAEQHEFPGSSGAEKIQERVAPARVVKAWNTVYSGVVRTSPEFDGVTATVFVAADDREAKATVAGLVRDLGFDAADAGPLASARCLEPLAALMTTLDRAEPGTLHALRLLRRPRISRASGS